MPSAEAHDSLQPVRRFHTSAEAAPRSSPATRGRGTAEGGGGDSGWTVLLDGRPPKTPAGGALRLPTEPLARTVAAEWDAQGEFIRFPTMPATRLAFTTLDHIGAARDAVAAEIARYAGSDLLCYFADEPLRLLQRQQREWGPVLDWAEAQLGLSFECTSGVLHRLQPPETLARVHALAADADDFALAGLAHATALFGSAVLALALQRGRLSGAEAFALSRLDEAHQEEQWGVDAEAAARTAAMLVEAEMLDGWFAALRVREPGGSSGVGGGVSGVEGLPSPENPASADDSPAR